MTILRSTLCAIGRHHGDWSLPGARCETTRVCASCGTAEERTRHVWGEFGYAGDGRCEQTRRCERCGSAQSRTLHDWGPWLYLTMEFDSPQAHTCRRCHDSERTRPTLK